MVSWVAHCTWLHCVQDIGLMIALLSTSLDKALPPLHLTTSKVMVIVWR